MQVDRVVEILGPPGGRRGSGYLITERLVLTAGHVTDRTPDADFQARPLGMDEWTTARRVWRGGCDAALLELTLPIDGITPVRLGRVAGNETAEVEGVGFPDAQAVEGPHDVVYDTEQFSGEIRPLSTLKRDQLSIKITSGAPTTLADGSRWAGTSGAGVFSGPLLIGVLHVDPTNWNPDRLTAVPVGLITADAAFRTLWQHATGTPPIVDAVEADGVLEPPPSPARRRALASSSFLTHPRNEIVPFRGRDDELARLASWASGDPSLEITLVTGPGGGGKSRLAREFCRQLDGKAWVTGLLAPAADRARIARLARVSAPMLVVIDYAETRLPDVATALAAIADQSDSTHARRVLLLARQTGEWWTALNQATESRAARDALERSITWSLPPAETTPDGRQDAFAAALNAFSRYTGPLVTAPSPPDLTSRAFDEVLFVHLAALSHLPSGGDVPTTPNAASTEQAIRNDLLSQALEREARYWAHTAQTAQLTADDRARRRSVTLATLAAPNETEAPGTETETAELLAVLPGQDTTTCHAIAAWLRDLYPHTPDCWIGPLEPDLLGEALTAQTVQAIPELASHIVTDARYTNRALTVLTRAARDHPAARHALQTALTEHFSELWSAAIEVAQATGDPIGPFLADILRQSPDLDLAARIEATLPERTVALRELAAVATEQALHGRQHDPHVVMPDPEAARLANNLAGRLRDLGRREDALTAIQEAVGHYRQLADARPDAFRPNLAMALSNLAVRLSALGRREDALTAIQEAVGHYRQLADARPDAFRPDLAMALSNLSGRLSALGRREDALTAIQEAVGDYRQLADARPDAFRPDLAMALSNLAVRLSALGRREDALTAIQEAVGHYRQLADARPDAFRPDLAMALSNLSGRLSALGRREDALTAIQEAVGDYRQLADARPDAFRPDLAMALNNLSGRLSALGRREDALTAIQEAVGHYRQLADARPDTFRPDLASTLNNLSNRLSDLGRREDALTAIQEAVGHYRQLADARPDAFRPDLASTLNNLSNRLSDLGRREDALTAIQEAVSIRRQQAEERPDAFLSDLAMALNNLSVQLGDLGRRRDALSAIREAVTRVLPLLERHPYYLPDAGERLRTSYQHRCREADESPDRELIGRLSNVLETAKALSVS